MAFAAIQQGRMNEEMTDAMKLADKRSQMASDLADIKAHLETGDEHPEKLVDVDKELQAFMEKYGDEPALADVTSTVGEIADNIHTQVKAYQDWVKPEPKYAEAAGTVAEAAGEVGDTVLTLVDGDSTSKLESESLKFLINPLDYADGTIKNWIDQITEKLDASGTNDQLAMIHIKQLNDNINNSSSMVSGIVESRNNATSSIINNIA